MATPTMAVKTPMPLDRWDEFAEALPVAFTLLDPQFIIERPNARFAKLFGVTRTRCMGQKLDDVAPSFARHVRDLAARAQRSKLPARKPFEGAIGAGNANAAEKWLVTVAATRFKVDGAESLYCFVSEPGTSHVADVDKQQAMQDRLDFERFLANLSAAFVTVPSQSVDDEIQKGLKQLVEFLGVDRATLVSAFSPDGFAVVVGSYAVRGMPSFAPGQQFGELAEMNWFTNELLHGRTVCLRSIDELPPDAVAERRFCQATGIQSYLGIPLNVAGLPLCVLGIVSKYTIQLVASDLIPRLRIIGEVFANALARRNADSALRQMHAELAHVTRASTVGQLATSIAHEISQPLSAILSNAHAAIRMLSVANPKTDVALAALRDIIADDKRAVAVVSKAHAMLKRRQTELDVHSINDIVHDVILLLHGDAQLRRIRVRTEFSKAAPAIKGDRVQLQQVVMNLLVNAMDSVDLTKREPREITVTTESVSEGVQVAVRDTGVGVPPDLLKKMFEPFFTTKESGLGMGLAINSEIVLAHGGRIWAVNNAKDGATVAFILPAASSSTSQ